jgi:hypothetical protein
MNEVDLKDISYDADDVANYCEELFRVIELEKELNKEEEDEDENN